MKETRPLRAYAEVTLGRQRSPEHADGPFMVPYLRAANVTDGKLLLDDVLEMNFTPEEQAVFALRAGDILVTEGSGSLRSVGASAVWNDDLPGLHCFQNTLLRLRPRGDTDPRFLAWWCRHAFASGEFAGIATGANIFHLSAERVQSLPMAYVAPEEQRAIADYLDRETTRLDALIAAKLRTMSLLSERLAAARDAVFAELSRPVARLGRFVKSLGQGFSPQAEDRRIEPGEWGVLKLSAVKAGRLIPSEHKALPPDVEPVPSLVPQEGDLLVTRANTPQLVGDVCAVRVTPERLILCDLIYVLHLSDALDARFVAEAMLTGPVRAQLSSTARGTSQSMVKLRADDVKRVEIAVPSLATQMEVVARLDAMRASHGQLEDTVSRSIRLLRERRQALITAGVTGGITVPVAA